MTNQETLTQVRYIEDKRVEVLCKTTHHPHTIVICDDFECGCGYEYLACHVCGQHWPCETKQEHLIARGKPWGKGHYILLEGRKVYELSEAEDD